MLICPYQQCKFINTCSHLRYFKSLKWLIFISKSCIFRLQKHKYDIVNGPLLMQKWPGNSEGSVNRNCG